MTGREELVATLGMTPCPIAARLFSVYARAIFEHHYGYADRVLDRYNAHIDVCRNCLNELEVA
jgi:hypothetical protein